MDSPEEVQDLIQECYKSSIRMLSTMELFEDSLQMQKSLYRKASARGASGAVTPALAERYEVFSETSYAVRTSLNTMIGALRFLQDALASSADEQSLMLKQTYEAALHIFDTFEELESVGNTV